MFGQPSHDICESSLYISWLPGTKPCGWNALESLNYDPEIYTPTTRGTGYFVFAIQTQQMVDRSDFGFLQEIDTKMNNWGRGGGGGIGCLIMC